MGGRSIPIDCPHGGVLDWGDFGPDSNDGSVGACEICNHPEADTDPPSGTPWRQGRSVGRTIYRTNEDGSERLIGVMDTPDLAEMVVVAVNLVFGVQERISADEFRAALQRRLAEGGQ